MTSGYPYVAIPQMHGGRLDLTTARRISEQDYIDWTTKAKPRTDDVVLSRRTNPGETARVPRDPEFAVGQNLLLLRSDGSRVYPPFLRWLVRGPEWWNEVRKYLNVGAVFDSLRLPDIPKFALQLPPIAEQRAIATTLDALDDKIDSNGRLAVTARESAKLLLQSASSDGDRLEVNRIAEVRKGLSYKGAGLATSGMPMVNMGSAAPYGWLKREGFKHYIGEYKPRHVVKGGSLLIVNTEQTWRQEIIGWPLILPIDITEALFTHHVFVVDFKPGWEWARWALWAHLFTPTAREFIDGRVYGTTVATLPAAAISELRFPVPKAGSGASESADALLKRSWAAEVESASLAAIRDALLPALLSGHIRVPEARADLEAVV